MDAMKKTTVRKIRQKFDDIMLTLSYVFLVALVAFMWWQVDGKVEDVDNAVCAIATLELVGEITLLDTFGQAANPEALARTLPLYEEAYDRLIVSCGSSPLRDSIGELLEIVSSD